MTLFLLFFGMFETLMGFFCRNFDEVLCSFVEPLSESALVSDLCSGLYDEENFKVSLYICLCF